jgi:uncharacterized protein YdeI (YjbR/CyaY-like superfamily)
MGGASPKVDAYLSETEDWQEEFRALRKIILGCPLTEELKWGQPCYVHGKKNVVVIQGFKDYCAIMFFKGVLLKDPEGLLVRPGTHTQAGRQIRFSNVRQIRQLKSVLVTYINEAIEIEKAGKRVALKATSDFTVPDEFQARLDGAPALKAAFEALTLGRQRAYLYYFSEAKQSKTREARVAKCIPRILRGLGLNDQ